MAANPIERLSLAELQSAFDADTLKLVDDLVQFLSEGGEGNQLPVSADKQRLATIYAYTNFERLSSSSARKKILQTLDEEELQELVEVHDRDLGYASREEIIEKVSKAPWRKGGLSTAFVEAVGLRSEALPEETSAPLAPGLQPNDIIQEPMYWPMDYQLQAHDDAIKAFTSPGSRVLLQLPTGAGKTYTALNILVSYCQGRRAKGQPCRIVWLAHGRELVSQALETFRRIWKHRGFETIECSLAWDGKGFPEAPNEFSIVFSTLQTARKHAANFNQADLIVLDEAHIALAPTYADTVRALEGHNCRTLGLTATPGRGALSAEENERLAEFFGNRMVGLTTTEQESAIQNLQNRRILSRIDWEPIETNVELELNENELDRLRNGKDFSEKLLKEIGNNLARNQVILDHLNELIADGHRILFFAPSVNQSKALSTVLRVNGINAMHIDGSTPKSAREFAINSFRNGDVSVLSNFGVLSAGFDAPSTDCVVIARPTTSIVEYSQMIGRGLRGPRLGGSARCKIVQVVDNFRALPTDLSQLYSAFNDYWR